MPVKPIFNLFKHTFQEWSQDKAPQLAAALAYYTIFSIAPLLIIVIAIIGFVLRDPGAQNRLLGQIQGLVGQNGAEMIRTMVENASRPGAGVLATVIGVVTLLLGASGVFGQLQTALNTIWGVMPKPGRGLWAVVKDRLLTFGMVLVIGFLLLVSLILSSAISALVSFLGSFLPPGTGGLLRVGDFLVSFGVITLLFALIYKFLPDIVIPWRSVWVGAAVTALLFVIGKFLIGLYLGRSSVSSTYGAAGSLVVLLIWIYYSAQILLFGAEFTLVYAHWKGAKVVPRDNAVPITEGIHAERDLAQAKAQARAVKAGAAPASAAQAPAQELPAASIPPRETTVYQLRPIGVYTAALVGFIVGLLGRRASRPKR